MGRYLVAVAAMALSTGCAMTGSLQTAHPIGKGKMQFALEPAAVGASTPLGFAVAPRLDFSLRYGLSDRQDLGARLGVSGLELMYKHQLNEPSDGGMIMSLAPTLGGGFFSVGAGTASSSFTVINVSVPLLLGFPVGDSQFIVGPRLQNTMGFGSASAGGSTGGGLVNILSVGTTVGFAAKLGDTFRIMPEIGVAYPIVGAAASGGSSTSGSLGGQGLMFQFGLGFLFGGA